MFVKINNFLNPTTITCSPSIETPTTNMGDYLFDGPSCIIESSKRILVVELLMFHRHSITIKECAFFNYGGRQIVIGGLMWHGLQGTKS